MNFEPLLDRLNRARIRAFGGRPKAAAADLMTTYDGLRRGINLGNALEAPSEGAWGVVLRKEYFATIQKAGFSCIRVPICWSAHASAEAPYLLDPVFLKRVDWVVAQATARHLHVILDFRNYEELYKDPAGNEERFVTVWRQIAEHFQLAPPSILFELLNEPHDKIAAATWNQLLARALAAIRPTNPERVVVVGPVNWNDIDALPSLALPDDDRNLVVTVHYYEPKAFTHQGADWVPGSSSWLGTVWQGTDVEKRIVEEALARASAWGRVHGRPVFLGEFGAYRKADMDSRERWTRHVARTAEARGVAWAYWEFCWIFGAYDPLSKKWREPLLNALIQDASCESDQVCRKSAE